MRDFHALLDSRSKVYEMQFDKEKEFCLLFFVSISTQKSSKEKVLRRQ
jgi:hypothetical protein